MSGNATAVGTSADWANRWEIVKVSHSVPRRGVYVLARCECGTARTVLRSDVLKGRSRSCGCLQRESVAARLTTHGLSTDPLYEIWEAIIQRCTNPNNKKWADYGGRGITVCERWRDFEAFRADMAPRPEGLTVDRIDVNGNYEPGNCRWATYSEQNSNRRPSEVCSNGHPRTPANTIHSFDSKRGKTRIRCADCNAVAQSRYRAKKRATS